MEGIFIKDEFERCVLELDLNGNFNEIEVMKILEDTNLIRVFHKESGNLIGEFERKKKKKFKFL